MPENRIIVAGADGYIGKRVRESISNKVGLLLLSPLMQPGYIHFDLLRISQFNAGLISPKDTVVMLAGISSPDLCSTRYNFSYEVNVTGTIRFIELCLGRGARVLFFSSDTVYTNTDQERDEDYFPEKPPQDYGMMKYMVEKYFRGEQNFKSFRLSYVFSWDDKLTAYLRNCLDQDSIAEIYDPLIRKVVYIEDVVSCIETISARWDEYSNQHFNMCGPQYVSRVGIADSFSNVIGKLKYKVVRPNPDFYRARPEKILIGSKYSAHLLGRDFTALEDALKLEKEQFS